MLAVNSRLTSSAMMLTLATAARSYLALLGAAVEFLGPVAEFVGFVDVGAGGGAALLDVIQHNKEKPSYHMRFSCLNHRLNQKQNSHSEVKLNMC